jgi:toxin ParE1/3/4
LLNTFDEITRRALSEWPGRFYEGASSLRNFPNKGRAGRVEGTRELSLPSLPFILVYRILKETVEIANVIHGAQKYPPIS